MFIKIRWCFWRMWWVDLGAHLQPSTVFGVSGWVNGDAGWALSPTAAAMDWNNVDRVVVRVRRQKNWRLIQVNVWQLEFLLHWLTSGSRIKQENFRVPADPDQLMTTRTRLDMFVVPVVHDPHVPAGLLKLWLRQLPEPLIPHAFYQRALSSSDNPVEVTRLIQVLPSINQLVISKLVACLQVGTL